MKLRYIGTSGTCFTNGNEYLVLANPTDENYYLVVDNDANELYASKSEFEALELSSKRFKAIVYSYVFEGFNDGSDPIYFEQVTVIKTITEDEETKFYCKWDRDNLDHISKQDIVSKDIICEKYFDEGEEDAFKAFLELFHLGMPSNSYEDNLEPKPHFKTVYERVQRYGGAEEGGWYYHNYIATDLSEDEVELGLVKYGEGYTLEEELFKNESEDNRRRHYC